MEERVLNGTRSYYYADGKKSCDETYKNAKLNGPYTEWHHNGKISKEANYEDEYLHGTFYKYYESGKIKEKAFYINGRRNGERTKWHDNGNKKSERNYEWCLERFINKETGTSYKWDSEGLLSEERINHEDGLRYCEIKYYSSGIKESEINYTGNKKDGDYKQWDSEGNITVDIHYTNDMRDIRIKTSDMNKGGKTRKSKPNYKQYKQAANDWSTIIGTAILFVLVIYLIGKFL